MDIDFRTTESVDDVDFFQIDDLAHAERERSAERWRPADKCGPGSWVSGLIYWFAELRWRRRFWKQNK